jgi:phage terminase large subunit
MVAALANPEPADYTPVGGCAAFYGSEEPEVLSVGPAGTGKTLAACWKLHHTALFVPGVRLLMARKVLEDLKTGALATYTNHVKPQLDNVVTFGGSRFYPAEFRYTNGSVIHVVGLDKPGKVMSAEYDIIYVNEATEVDEITWQALTSRLRNGVLAYQQLIADCNPSGPRHWLNVRCNAGITRRIQTTHRDNPAYWDMARGEWTAMGRTYVQQTLESLTGVQRKRLLDGVWAAAEGIVYPEFVPEMIRDEDVTGWTTYLAADIGSKNPTVILTCHVAGDGRVHVSREFYRRDMGGGSNIVDAITTEADRCNPDMIYVDSSAKWCIDDLVGEGYMASGTDKDVLAGIQRFRAILTGGFSIDPSCINTIDEFGLYAYPDNPRIETDKPVKEHDHAMDALRYLASEISEPVLNLADFYRSAA